MTSHRHASSAGSSIAATAEPVIRPATSATDIAAAHRLLSERIGPCLVEDAASFRQSATLATADWRPRLLIAEAEGRVVGAQVGGLLPAVGLLSLPYTAVASDYEGRGLYRAIKRRMLADLDRLAAEAGLPLPIANVSEEAAGSVQFRRKTERVGAVALPFPYWQPAAQGLTETPLILTFEPLRPGAQPPATPAEYLSLVTALYRGLYRLAEPASDPTYQRIAAALAGPPHADER